MIAKAELNYNITDFRFIYMFAPAIGTVVVSNHPFPGATIQKDAFRSSPAPRMSTLTVKVTVGEDEHTLELASENPIIARPGHAESAYVLLDRDFMLPSRYPVVGYGKVDASPYQWPGGKPNGHLSARVVVDPLPKTPKNLLPTMLLSACPPGQMRLAAPPVLPGEVVPDQPCVSIALANKPGKSAPPASANPAPAAADAATAPGTAPAVAPTASPDAAPGAPAPDATPAAAPAAPETPPATTSATPDATPAAAPAAPAMPDATSAAPPPAPDSAPAATPPTTDATPAAAPPVTDAAPPAMPPTPDAAPAAVPPAAPPADTTTAPPATPPPPSDGVEWLTAA
jgi:hypothetical protein